MACARPRILTRGAPEAERPAAVPAQLTFLSLFLGLVSGPQTVTIAPTGPIAAIEFLLDSSPLGVVHASPWSLQVDFGPALLPHELEVRGTDAAGREVARARQFVNLPRAPAQVDLLLERSENGRRLSARWIWKNLTGVRPGQAVITLDGRPLTVKDGAERVELPSFDETSAHLLSAEIRFADGTSARHDLAFGGALGSETAAELTAVPLRTPGRHARLEVTDLDGWFLAHGEKLRVVAAEAGAAQLLLVRYPRPDDAPTIPNWARQKMSAQGASLLSRSARTAPPDLLRFELRLGEEDRARFLWPVPQQVSAGALPARLFPSSPEFSGRDGGLFWLLSRIGLPSALRDPPRFADAVAVAGLQAATGNHRRAVVLVLGQETEDPSHYEPAAVRSYLAAMRVPFFVWSLRGRKDGLAAAWGGAEDISTLPKLTAAYENLRDELLAQRIVWLDGLHVPNEIELSSPARVAGATLAGAGRL